MMKEALDLQKLVVEEAKKYDVPRSKVLSVWQHAYNLHRETHGSYKHKALSPNYHTLMLERYNWCYEQCLTYIIEQVRLNQTA